jgi:hypothetical protein
MSKIAVIGAGKIFNDKYLYLLKWLKFTRKIISYDVFDLKEHKTLFYEARYINKINYNYFDSFLLLTPNSSHNDFIKTICENSSPEKLNSIIIEKPIFTKIDAYNTSINFINKIHSVNPKRAISSVINAHNFFVSNKKFFGKNVTIEISDGIPLKWNASYLSSKNLFDSCLWDIGAHDFDVCAHVLGINNKHFKILSYSVKEFSFQNYFSDFIIFFEESNLKINFSVRLSRVNSFLPRILVKLQDFNEIYQMPLINGADFLIFNEKDEKWSSVIDNNLLNYTKSELSAFLGALNNKPSIIYPICTDVKFSINILEQLSKIHED